MNLIDANIGIQLVQTGSTRLKSPKFETFLYNSTSFLKFQSDRDPLTFQIFTKKNHEELARIHFFLVKGEALSPLRSPFGSFEMSDQMETEVLYDSMRVIHQQLEDRGIQRVRIINYPQIYHPAHATQTGYVLLHHGYKVAGVDINHHLLIGSQEFEQGLHLMEKRKLKKCLNQSFCFREVSIDHLEEVYQFIFNCRKERGQVLSLSLEELTPMVNAFPNHYQLFEVTHDGEMVAASISVKVHSKILYNFYPASSKKYHSFSPMVFLLKHQYEYCRRHQYRVLDLGTSTLEGKPNLNLIQFKENLGGIPSMKFTYQKDLI